jgi:hypothetical protein
VVEGVWNAMRGVWRGGLGGETVREEDADADGVAGMVRAVGRERTRGGVMEVVPEGKMILGRLLRGHSLVSTMSLVLMFVVGKAWCMESAPEQVKRSTWTISQAP